MARQFEALAASGTSLEVGRPVTWRDAGEDGPGLLVVRFIEGGRAGFDEALGPPPGEHPGVTAVEVRGRLRGEDHRGGGARGPHRGREDPVRPAPRGGAFARSSGS